MKPIMLLDVDGVLNVVGLRIKPIEVTVCVRGEKLPMPFRPARYAREFMHWAWDMFDVHWMTCWESAANALAVWAGLPARPVVRTRRDHQGTTDWKAHAARRLFTQFYTPLVWVEDGISDEAREWIAECPSRLFLYADPRVGVTPAHRKQIEEWLARMYGKSVAP